MGRDLIDLYTRRDAARNSVELAEINAEIEMTKARMDLQKHALDRGVSPMILGQYGIVLPFVMWWGAIHIVSVFGPALGWDWVVLDTPEYIKGMAEWLIPLIVVGTIIDRARG